MTETILVTSTRESTGKTAITLALGELARERGLSVGYMKPKGTRLRSNVGKTLDQDPMLAREVLGTDDEMHQMEPIVYSPTFVEGAIRGQEDPDELADVVRKHYEEIAADRDLVLIEGGGRWTTGGLIDLTDPEVAALLDASVLVVAEYTESRDVDELLAAVDDVRSAVGDDGLEGVLFNRVTEDAHETVETDVVPFLEGRDVPVVGVLPREQRLAGVTVGDLADELGAEVLTSASTDGYVERFLVGAMGPDEALRFFRRARDAAVVTGGDRTDIHTAALEAPGVKCLILTGGHRPPSAVLGTAEERGVPVLLVNTDTMTVVDRAEDVVSGGRTRDAETVALMRELLSDYADVDALLAEETGTISEDTDGEAADGDGGDEVGTDDGDDGDA